MPVGVYLDKGRASETPESAETEISETPGRHFKKYNPTNKQQNVNFTAEFTR